MVVTISTTKEDLGIFLKRIRKEAGFNLSQLSRASNISQPYLTQIESGERIPTPEVLKRLADGLCYVTNGHYSYGTLLEKAGYEELAKGQKLLELQRQGMAEENQPSRISTPKENSKGGDKMYRGEKLKVKLIRGMTAGFDDTIDDNVNAWIASNEQAIVMDIKVVHDTRPYHVSALIIYKEPSEKGV